MSGVRASYNLSGRRLEGELSFAYNTLTYRARLTQVSFICLKIKNICNLEWKFKSQIFFAQKTRVGIKQWWRHLYSNDFSQLVPRSRETWGCWSFSWRMLKVERWRWYLLIFSSLLIQNKLLAICENLRLCLLFPKTCRCTGSVLSTGWQEGKCQIWSKKPSFRSNHFVSGAFVIFFLILVIIVVHHWKWSSCPGGWVGAKTRPWGSARPTFNLLSGYKISWFS